MSLCDRERVTSSDNDGLDERDGSSVSVVDDDGVGNNDLDGVTHSDSVTDFEAVGMEDSVQLGSDDSVSLALTVQVGVSDAERPSFDNVRDSDAEASNDGESESSSENVLVALSCSVFCEADRDPVCVVYDESENVYVALPVGMIFGDAVPSSVTVCESLALSSNVEDIESVWVYV